MAQKMMTYTLMIWTITGWTVTNLVTVAMKMMRKNTVIVMIMMIQVIAVKVKAIITIVVMTHLQTISCKHVHAVYVYMYTHISCYGLVIHNCMYTLDSSFILSEDSSDDPFAYQSPVDIYKKIIIRL